jgi:hypothetical protein
VSFVVCFHTKVISAKIWMHSQIDLIDLDPRSTKDLKDLEGVAEEEDIREDELA